jgi:hypothetical protein
MSAPPDKRRLDAAILRAALDLGDDRTAWPAMSAKMRDLLSLHEPVPGQAVPPLLDVACDRIAAELGIAPKQAWRRLETLMERKGYLECGVSIRTAWLTDKGRARLAELETP